VNRFVEGWRSCAGLLILAWLVAHCDNLSVADEPMPPTPCASENTEPARPVRGSLVICGGGKLPEPVLNRFLELAGGPQARIVVIPTASALADTPEGEQKLAFWREAKVTTLDVLHTRSRAQASDPKFVKPLEQATGVWFTGGFQWRLADTYLGTAVERLVHAVLERGGVIGGTSSGAAIMSTVMIRKGYPEVELGKGFDFLPGTVIDQHFIKRNRQDRLVGVIESHPGFVGLGIDEGTAVVAQGRTLSVIGDSQVIACLAPSDDRPLRMDVLRPGDEVDLVALSRAAIARAKKVPHPSGQPKLEHGTLIMVGGGKTPPEVAQRFIAAAGGRDAPLVVVTTADADRQTDAAATAWLKKAGARNVAHVHTAQRDQASDPALLATLQQARGVWFGGGRQWRLVDAFLDTPAEKAFHQVLERGGVIGGSSAGATIQAGYLLRGNPMGNEDMLAEGYERGFGFLDGVAIDQHFSQRQRQSDMAQLKRRHPELIGLGLDEATALVIHGGRAEVVGENIVSIYAEPAKDAENAPDCEVLHAGDRYDFEKSQTIRSATASNAASN
jgi:cyanophycinase